MSKAQELYRAYCDLKKKAGESPDELKLSDRWLAGWWKEYRVLLKHPNKIFTVSIDAQKEQIIQFLKNVWRTHSWWLQKYKVDPPILSADQMPLYRNEWSSLKKLNFKGRDQSCFVKENHHLSRERCTVMTITSSSKELKPPPLEFVFKGKGLKVTVNPPGKFKVQWAEKGSYHVEHMLEYIKRLSTIPVAFAPSNQVTFTLDHYSAHLPTEIENAIFQKGYIGGGIIGNLQAKDTTYHKDSKAAYRKKECN